MMQPQNFRSYRLSHDNAKTYREIEDSYLDLTKGLPGPSLEKRPLSDIYRDMFNYRLEVFPDGQRSVVCDQRFMISIVKTIRNGNVIDPLLVNETDKQTVVYKGKQRMTSLYAFFIGLFPVQVDGRDLYFQHPRDAPHGWSYLFRDDNVNSNGKRETLSKSIKDRWWFNSIKDKPRMSEQAPVKVRVFSEAQREDFLAKTLDFQVLPNWPANAVALHAAWTEMNCYKHSAPECIYSLPGLGEFKRVETSLVNLGKKVEIINDAKQVFCDCLRAYMIACGADFVPFARDLENYGAIICEVLRFREKQPTHRDVKVIDRIANGASRLSALRACLTGGNKRSIKSLSSDTLVAIIIASAKKQTTEQINKVIHAFRASRTARREILPRTYKDWERGEKTGNFALVVQAALA